MISHRIQKMDSDGNFVTKCGSQGEGDDQFKSPYCVAVDLTRNVYVDDYSHDRNQVYAATE